MQVWNDKIYVRLNKGSDCVVRYIEYLGFILFILVILI